MSTTRATTKTGTLMRLTVPGNTTPLISTTCVGIAAGRANHSNSPLARSFHRWTAKARPTTEAYE